LILPVVLLRSPTVIWSYDGFATPNAETDMRKPKAVLSGTLKEEFKKDLQLFEHFLVLLNHSSPIRNVELMWAADLDLFETSQWPRVTTGEALVQLQAYGAGSPERSSPSPSTLFCDLVHGFGAYEEQTCGRSDKPAKERCRNTGCSQVYPCHVGLTDIAVPVLCQGQYLGTLFSGQVLTTQPTEEGFADVKAALQNQSHIDMAQLEQAYYRVPVVTPAQLAEMVRMLEVFARYIANSWKRLEIMSDFQRVKARELALDRRELAEMILTGQIGSGPEVDLHAVRALAREVGLTQLPDRVMVLRVQPCPQESSRLTPIREQRSAERVSSIGGHLTLARVMHLIDDQCHSWPNTLATVVAPGEMCILTTQKARTPGHEHILQEEMGEALLRTARSEGFVLARVGISSIHGQPTELLHAYHEALSALESGQTSVSWFESLPGRKQEPSQALNSLLKALQSADSAAVSSTLRDFLATATPATNTGGQLQQARGLLTWACEHMVRELSSLGILVHSVSDAKDRTIQTIVASSSAFAMAEAFRKLVEMLRQQMGELYSHREEKIVAETQRLVRQLGAAKVTIQDLASNLKLSAGHLGRVYSRTTGHTLEEYLISQRLEMSKRLLLDPRLHVAEVADQCGFCNPAYFSSVFKKYMHCTPRAYASEPQRWGSSEPGARSMERAG
jgi:AraC-like DNA-binding protein/ligand-binding sensor protein